MEDPEDTRTDEERDASYHYWASRPVSERLWATYQLSIEKYGEKGKDYSKRSWPVTITRHERQPRPEPVSHPDPDPTSDTSGDKS